MFNLTSVDTMDALKMAIQCEMDMKAFYQQVAQLLQNDDAVSIFQGLAEKEEKHRIKLIRLYSRLSGKKILYLNLGKKHKLGTLQPCPSDPNLAVRQAKKNANELKNFYLTIARRMFQNELRQFFREMALEEEQHIAVLESSFIEPLSLNQSDVHNQERMLREMTASNKNQSNSW